MGSTHHGDPPPDRRPDPRSGPRAGQRRRPGFDPTSIDLTDFDVVRAVRSGVGVGGAVATRAADLAASLARDATYVTVGFGLLGYQRAQVRRREFERSRRR
jgi:hypothetical protein